jgi:hypothetical protein
MASKLDKERRKNIIYRCFNAFRVNAGKKFQNLYQQLSQNTAFGQKAA